MDTFQTLFFFFFFLNCESVFWRWHTIAEGMITKLVPGIMSESSVQHCYLLLLLGEKLLLSFVCVHAHMYVSRVFLTGTTIISA